MQCLSPYAFVLSLIFFLGIGLSGVDRIAFYFSPEYEKEGKYSPNSRVLDGIVASQKNILARKRTSTEAKNQSMFWAANIEGVGLGVNLLAETTLIEAIFPGYGDLLAGNNQFWKKYFENEFGANGYILSNPKLSQYELKVSYSWMGCLDLYRSYGADILVLGSSEVYMGLIPELISRNMTPIFLRSPKVLFCATPAMTGTEVALTARELQKLESKKPDIVIWGYSFWSAYTNSKKLAEYHGDKIKELDRYLSKRKYKNMDPLESSLISIQSFSANKFFPKIDWDDIAEFTIDKIRSNHSKYVTVGNSEGVYLKNEQVTLDNAYLSEYLKNSLKPYYAITQGVLNKDCDMSLAKSEYSNALSELKKLSNHIYVYLTPTTTHQRETVPHCFLPSVKKMLTGESRKEGVNLLVDSAEIFGIGNRDFIHPTLNPELFYFDINHTNSQGAQKTTNIITGWVIKDLKNLKFPSY